ncbi:helix-turn-helix transcriptional regulator [Myroides sp. DF42-4-2]|uniref:helix-turn-helix domain-containing protein n=1 Tax=unclassified Myroides TaxID=2642485 RepID=UPI002578374E|nr:helix-turn-helix transcriptional regulator [Myroides sp. DF42-4-2]
MIDNLLNSRFIMQTPTQKCKIQSEKMRSRRKELGFSQEYVAMKLNISQKAYSDIESGKTKLKNDVLNEIAVILEISPFEICPIACDCTSDLQTKHGKLIQYLQEKDVNFPEELI